MPFSPHFQSIIIATSLQRRLLLLLPSSQAFRAAVALILLEDSESDSIVKQD
jgi:hypothetical protein